MTMSVKVLPRPADIDVPSPEKAASVTGALNLVLVDSFSLYLKTRKYGSLLSTPGLRGYYLLLEEQAKQILETTDAVVERICMIDPHALGSMGDFVRYRRPSDRQPRGPLHALLMTLRDDNLALAETYRCVSATVSAADDLISASLIDLWTEESERRARFLFETSRL